MVRHDGRPEAQHSGQDAAAVAAFDLARGRVRVVVGLERQVVGGEHMDGSGIALRRVDVVRPVVAVEAIAAVAGGAGSLVVAAVDVTG